LFPTVFAFSRDARTVTINMASTWYVFLLILFLIQFIIHRHACIC
jgi:hypothetical protein